MSENTTELGRVEALLGDLVKSLNEQTPVDSNAEVIAKGADLLVAEAKESNERISKSIDAIPAALTQLSVKVDALAETVHTKIEKSLADIAAQPMPSRAVQSVADLAVEQPSAPVAITKEQVISKALTELPTATGDRKLQLLSGIAKLDTNYAPAEIAAELNLR